MPLPTTYTESIFADYLASVLGPVAGLLGWDAGSVQVIEAVNDALLEMGLASIAEATTASNVRGLRALGRRAIWRAVAQATAGNYSFSSDGQRFDRQQVHEHAVKVMELAESECRSFGLDPVYEATLLTVRRPSDPYQVIPDEERVA